jgi:plastocyanin
VVEVAAQNIAFTPTELSVAPDVAFQIDFANNDAGIPHNVAIKDAAGKAIFTGDIFNGVETRTYDVQPLPAGTYQFICSVHPNMTGTLTAQ